MDLLLNFGFAWIAVALTVVLAVKYAARKGAQKDWPFKQSLIKINRVFKKSHIYLGIALLVAGFIHGYYSSQNIFSINLGTACWVLTIILGISYVIKKSLNRIKPWIIIHRVLTLFMIYTLVWHVIDVGGIQAIRLMNDRSTIIYEISKEAVNSDAASTSDNSKYADTAGTLEDYNNSFGEDVKLKDGTFTGVAQGYGPNLTVSVAIKENQVIKITVTSHNEKDSKYYAAPMRLIPDKIIETQSLDIDTVSRATMTSVGIINAVNDALSKALINGKLPVMKTLPRGGKGRF